MEGVNRLSEYLLGISVGESGAALFQKGYWRLYLHEDVKRMVEWLSPPSPPVLADSLSLCGKEGQSLAVVRGRMRSPRWGGVVVVMVVVSTRTSVRPESGFVVIDLINPFLLLTIS